MKQTEVLLQPNPSKESFSFFVCNILINRLASVTVSGIGIA